MTRRNSPKVASVLFITLLLWPSMLKAASDFQFKPAAALPYLLAILVAGYLFSFWQMRAPLLENLGFNRALIRDPKLAALVCFLIAVPAVLHVEQGDVRIYSVLILPIIEELFFRGLMVTSMASFNIPLSIVLSASLFSSSHLFAARTLEDIVSPLFGGVALAALMLHYRSILPPILLHIAWNWASSPPSNLTQLAFPYYGGLLASLFPLIYLPASHLWHHYAAKRCWVCRRSEADLRRLVKTETVFVTKTVASLEVNICVVCDGMRHLKED